MVTQFANCYEGRSVLVRAINNEETALRLQRIGSTPEFYRISSALRECVEFYYVAEIDGYKWIVIPSQLENKVHVFCQQHNLQLIAFT